MKTAKTARHLGAIASFLVGAVCIAPATAIAWPDPVGIITDGIRGTLSDIANKYVVNPAETAAKSAADAASFAATYNYDGVADEVIQAMVARSSLQPFITVLESRLIPDEIRTYTSGAGSVLKVMDDEIGTFKTTTFKSLYTTYKNDLAAAAKAGSAGDFSAFYRYILIYGIASADWSNPNAAKASALAIARDQYAVYQWYSSHTLKGAAIGTASNKAGQAGLTNEAIASGVKGIASEFQANKGQGNTGMLGALIAAQFASVAREAQCAVNPFYCAQPGQRLCGAASEQHTISLHNKTNAPLNAWVHVRANDSHCENHVCDLSGPLEPGKDKMCAVYGQWDTNKVEIYVQAWDPRGSNPRFQPHPLQNEFPPVVLVKDGNPAFQAKFNKSTRNSIDIGYDANGELCIDCGYPTFTQKPFEWAGQPPTDTIRDARGQLACAPVDRPGVGRAFQDGNKTWYCEFGHDGKEHRYTSNFRFLKVTPMNAKWVVGPNPRTVGSFKTPATPVCRANPGAGREWLHMEFGWVYREGCVLGWGGRSPTIPQYETLVVQ